jgi:hypothetical protein
MSTALTFLIRRSAQAAERSDPTHRPPVIFRSVVKPLQQSLLKNRIRDMLEASLDSRPGALAWHAAKFRHS